MPRTLGILDQPIEWSSASVMSVKILERIAPRPLIALPFRRAVTRSDFVPGWCSGSSLQGKASRGRHHRVIAGVRCDSRAGCQLHGKAASPQPVPVCTSTFSGSKHGSSLPRMATPEEREHAFGHIYRAHYQAIAAYARRRLVEHDADDAVAETFLVAWRRLEDIPPGDLT